MQLNVAVVFASLHYPFRYSRYNLVCSCCEKEKPNAMKNTYSLSRGKLVLTSGVGIPNYSTREEGSFQVRYQDTPRNSFSLIKASQCDSQLEEEASVWAKSARPALLDGRCIGS